MGDLRLTTDKKYLKNVLTNKRDDVWKTGYFKFEEADFSNVTGGFEATKEITLFTYATSDPGVFYSRRPHFEVYHYTKDGSGTTIFDGTDFQMKPCDFTIFNDRSTGEVDRQAQAELTQNYSVPNFTVNLKVTYFTDSATGFTHSKDGINYFFYVIYTTNVVESFEP